MGGSFAESSYRMMTEPIAAEQALLFISFVNTNMSLEDYFKKQKKIDSLQLQKSEERSWASLLSKNLSVHEHEKNHFNIYEKYGIKSKLFFDLIMSMYFVMDLDFHEVSLQKKFSKEKVIRILAEMFIAPYKSIGGDRMSEYRFDIPCYEILKGNIKSVSLSEFEDALKKYQK